MRPKSYSPPSMVMPMNAPRRRRTDWQRCHQRHKVWLAFGSMTGGVRCRFIEANGARIPAIGLGTWELRGRTCARLVEQALRFGYRHIDTAQMYENEREVGEGVRASGVERNDVFVTTKVWTTHFAPNDLERSVKESLGRLRMTRRSIWCCCTGPIREVPLSETLSALASAAARHGAAHRRVEFHRGTDRAGGPLLPGTSGLRSGRVSSVSRSDQGSGSVPAPRLALVAYSPVAKGRVKNDETLAGSGPHTRRQRRRFACAGSIQQNVAAIPRTSRIRTAVGKHRDFRLRSDR